MGKRLSNAERLRLDERQRVHRRLADPDHADVLHHRLGVEAHAAGDMALAREAILVRSRGLCEGNWEGVCPPGPHPGRDAHHVQLKAQGGPDIPENLLFLCRKVHRYAHDVDRAGAEARGIIARGTGAAMWDHTGPASRKARPPRVKAIGAGMIPKALGPADG
jgi:hypothetical protein